MACKTRCGVILKKNLLLCLTLVGVLFGLVIGFAIRPLEPSEDALMWLGLPGQLYLRLLKMTIVPLIVASVITGTAHLEPKANGKISLVAIVYIFLTNMMGAVLGVIVFIVFKPGVRDTDGFGVKTADTQVLETQDIFADMIRNIFPDNLVESTFRQSQTKYAYENKTIFIGNNTEVITKVLKSVGKAGGTNFLGLVFACTVLGMATSVAREKGRVLVEVCESVTATIVIVIQWFMWTTPIGVVSLILVAVADISDIGEVMRQLGLFIASVTTGLIVQQLVVFCAMYFIVTRKNPFRFMLDISRPWLIAFASSATVVAMPEMLTICEYKLKLDGRVARFVIPLSVTLSSNGSAVFIACAALFISNLTGTPPTAADMCTIGILTAVSAMAIPSVPSASIVTIVMILTSMNIPADPIGLLLAVEFFLDRLRTTSSVVSDMICVVITEKICLKDLKSYTKEDSYMKEKEYMIVNGKERDHEDELRLFKEENV